MPENAHCSSFASAAPGAAFTRRTVTTTLVIIAGLTFVFSFGNIWSLGLRLGVHPWLAPLIGPAVDLSVVGLLVGIRYCTLNGTAPAQLRSARVLLTFSGVTTLALNVAEPASSGDLGRALFDSAGPLLLIGWSEVGPSLLRQIHATRHRLSREEDAPLDGNQAPPDSSPTPRAPRSRLHMDNDQLLEQARQADREHQLTFGRPISADTLRSKLSISSAKARTTTRILREERSLHGRQAHIGTSSGP